MEVHYQEIRRLSTEWELDCERCVDIPFITTCYRYGIGNTRSVGLVQNIDLLSESLCTLLASSTRHLLHKLNGEENARFISDMAPFNVNFWLLDGDVKLVMASKKA